LNVLEHEPIRNKNDQGLRTSDHFGQAEEGAHQRNSPTTGADENPGIGREIGAKATARESGRNLEVRSKLACLQW
jgi:hypothetical protein